MDEGAASRMRARNHPRGRGVTDEGVVSRTRARCHGRGRGVMDEGAVRETSALWMRRAVSRSRMMID